MSRLEQANDGNNTFRVWKINPTIKKKGLSRTRGIKASAGQPLFLTS